MQGVPDNKSDVAVCQAVAGIARSLGLGLVAEGVETDAQRQFLLDLGVTIGQGFLFAPGLTPDELALRIARPAPREPMPEVSVRPIESRDDARMAKSSAP